MFTMQDLGSWMAQDAIFDFIVNALIISNDHESYHSNHRCFAVDMTAS